MTDSEIIEALATKVMGWTCIEGARDGEHLDGDRWHIRRRWFLGDDMKACEECGNMPEWLTNPADSKQVREKLAERWDYIRVEWSRHYGLFNVIVQTVGRANPEEFQAEADIEERAVALCALKSVGINVE